MAFNISAPRNGGSNKKQNFLFTSTFMSSGTPRACGRSKARGVPGDVYVTHVWKPARTGTSVKQLRTLTGQFTSDLLQMFLKFQFVSPELSRLCLEQSLLNICLFDLTFLSTATGTCFLQKIYAPSSSLLQGKHLPFSPSPLRLNIFRLFVIQSCR